MSPEITMAIMMLALIAAFFGAGFAAGYRGTWWHTTTAAGTIFMLFDGPRLVGRLFFHYHHPAKGIGADALVGLLVILGSLVGALLAKKQRPGTVLGIHAGIAIGAIMTSMLVTKILRSSF